MGFHRLTWGALALAACGQAPVRDAAPAGASVSPEVELLLAAYRPDDPDSDALFRFVPGHDIETFDGDAVRVHFTRTGPDAVREADADADGVPDAVETAAESYDEVLAYFAGIGFRPPVTDIGAPQGDGGDGRLDVYLIDFAGSSDGAWVRERCLSGPKCSGYVVQENDFLGYGYPSYRVASRILSSHELFHAVQAAYDADQGANWSEATAVWASERFDPSLDDLEGFADGWLEKPDRSIDQEPTGPVDAYSYGLGIFAQYLWERFGDDVHLNLWDAVEDGAGGVANPHWVSALAGVLEADFATSFAAEWVTFATWVLRCGHDDSGGPTFGSAAVLPRVARETETLPFQDDKLRVYPTSMQVWSARKDELAVAIVSTEAGDTDGLVLVSGVRDGDAVVTTVHEGLTATIDGSGQDEVIVAIVNTNLEGNSKRPGLCLGSVDEVAGCVASLTPFVEPVVEEAVEVAEIVESEAGPEVVEEASEAEVVEGAAEVVEVVEPKRKSDEGCTGGVSSGIVGALCLLWVRRRATRGPGKLGPYILKAAIDRVTAVARTGGSERARRSDNSG